MKKQLILVHGSGGNGNVFWFPYLRNHFEQKGWTVIAPDFSGGQTPNVEQWLTEATATFTLTPQTTLVGHSLGCPFIMSLLSRSEVQVEKVVCVAGLYQQSRFAHLNFLEGYAWDKIQMNVEKAFFIHSDNDPWDCDEREADYAIVQMGGEKVILPGQGHFGSGRFNQSYPEFPLLIKLIEG